MNIPAIIGVSEHYNALNTYYNRKVELFYDNIDPEATAQNGYETAYPDQKGYLYLCATTVYKRWFTTKTEYEFYKYSTDQLENSSKVVTHMVLTDILDISESIYGSATEKSESKVVNYENAISYYNFTDGANPVWKLGVNLDVLANTSMLSTLDLTLNSTTVNGLNYLSSADLSTKLKFSIITMSATGRLENKDILSDNWAAANANWTNYLKAHRGDQLTAYA